MPIKLKKANTTYQLIRNKISKDKIKDMFEVCMDHMMIKSEHETTHVAHLEVVFREVQKYNM